MIDVRSIVESIEEYHQHSSIDVLEKLIHDVEYKPIHDILTTYTTNEMLIAILLISRFHNSDDLNLIDLKEILEQGKQNDTLLEESLIKALLGTSFNSFRNELSLLEKSYNLGIVTTSGDIPIYDETTLTKDLNRAALFHAVSQTPRKTTAELLLI